MKKKIVSLALIIAMLAIAIVGGTLAYFTDTKSTTNTFTVGNVKIELEEPNWVDVTTATPGVDYPKDPFVKNVGKNDCWVRVNVTISDVKAFADACAAHGISDLSSIFNTINEEQWDAAGAVVDTTADTVTYSYRWKFVVPVGNQTNFLFESVTIPGVFTPEEMAALGDDFTITVTADAIQAEGFNDAASAFVAFDAN